MKESKARKYNSKRVKYVIYCRVSSAHQNSPDNVSLQAQEVECNTFAIKCGWTVRTIRKDIHSAFKSKPPELSQLLKGTNQVIIIYDVSRFSRSRALGQEMIDNALQNANTLMFVKENIRVNSYVSAKSINSYLMVTEQESTLISERIRNSKKYLRDNGMYQGGYVPYGMKKQLQNKVLIKDAHEQNIIAFIRYTRRAVISAETLNKLMAAILHVKVLETRIVCIDENGNENSAGVSLSYKDIAALLNDYNITKRGREWTTSSVKTVSIKTEPLATWSAMSDALPDDGLDDNTQLFKEFLIWRNRNQ